MAGDLYLLHRNMNDAWTVMTKAKEFLDYWIENSIHAAEQYGHRGGDIELSDLVERCVKMARAQGFSIHDLEGEVGNLRDYIREALARANKTEDSRTDRHQNKG